MPQQERSGAVIAPASLRRNGMPALTKRDLVLQICEHLDGVSQDVVTEILHETLNGIIEALAAGRPVEFRDFGVFSLVRRRARTGRNPKRPTETVEIPERTVVKFKPGKQMKLRVGA